MEIKPKNLPRHTRVSRLQVRKEDRMHRRRNRISMQRSGAAEESEKAFTMAEIERVIQDSKNNKASGDDDIPYEFIKHLGQKAKDLLFNLYNRCWDGEGIPRKWRTAIIKPLLKDGKDPKQTTSYRPISLTACMGKLLEKMVADRLIYVLEDRNLLNDSQAGFPPNRCTTDQILKLFQQATDQLHSSFDNTRTITAFSTTKKPLTKSGGTASSTRC